MPTPPELGAQTMLTLAHGAKGIFFEPYYTYGDTITGLVYKMQNGIFLPRDLFFKAQSIAERLHGSLGARLASLDYTGNYIKARYFVPTDDPSNQTYDYLTLPYNQSASTMNWHVGFFNRNGYSDDKYFFLVNLLPNTPKSVQVKVTPPVTGFYNYRFRDYEGQFDTTFFSGSYLTYSLSHPAGEGYLYEVAPVVKYGGKLYYPDTISNALTLSDDMTIEDGVTLKVNALSAEVYLQGVQ